MEGNIKANRIHPLVAGAAVSVMLVSLTGVAAITGILPTSQGSAAPPSPVAAAAIEAMPPATPAKLTEAKEESAPKPEPKRAPVAKRSEPARTSPQATRSPPAVAQAPAICYNCGRVESIREVREEAEPSGVGMVAGAVIGGALGNQVGGGNGRKLATVAGAIGGGYAGNRIEKSTRSTVTYQVRVRMEDGEVRTFPYAQQPGWGVGDRVRVVDGQLTSRA